MDLSEVNPEEVEVARAAIRDKAKERAKETYERHVDAVDVRATIAELELMAMDKNNHLLYDLIYIEMMSLTDYYLTIT